MNLITWNVQWCRGCDGRVNPARISKVVKDMADVDVLCLQEVARNFPDLEGSAGEDQYETLAGLFPGYTVVRGVATDVLSPGGARREFGNALITRLPVLQVYRRLLPWPADAAVPSMQRAAIEAVLQAPFGPLRVTTTHLEYYSAKQRAAQVEALRELQLEAAGHAAAPQTGKEGGPFEAVPRPASAILTADFNFRADDPLHARLQAPLGTGVPAYRDAWQLRHPGRPHAPTLGVYDKAQWPGPPFACDFIFVSEDIAHRVQDVVVNAETDASDHQPVLLVLRG
ncbi:MAG TPA: endonuclease/exonuclease/phosphatase family protein [Burkholderiales bacterium]|nr:endonuclease/exonuclease/phosphatase family protein [Burkholderiales bacterium]